MSDTTTTLETQVQALAAQVHALRCETATMTAQVRSLEATVTAQAGEVRELVDAARPVVARLTSGDGLAGMLAGVFGGGR